MQRRLYKQCEWWSVQSTGCVTRTDGKSCETGRMCTNWTPLSSGFKKRKDIFSCGRLKGREAAAWRELRFHTQGSAVGAYFEGDESRIRPLCLLIYFLILLSSSCLSRDSSWSLRLRFFDQRFCSLFPVFAHLNLPNFIILRILEEQVIQSDWAVLAYRKKVLDGKFDGRRLMGRPRLRWWTPRCYWIWENGGNAGHEDIWSGQGPMRAVAPLQKNICSETPHAVFSVPQTSLSLP